MSSTLVSYSNHFYGGISNTEVNKEQLYSSSANKGKLSVLRQVSGTITIPTGTILTDGVTKTLPILDENSIQIIVPIHSIILNVEYSTVPFGSAEAGLLGVIVQSFVSTTPYTLALPYTAGSSLSAADTFTSINQNILKAASAATGCLGLFGVGTLLSSGSTVTTTQTNVLKVTIYYSDTQDLNN